MSRKKRKLAKSSRRSFTPEFREEAVQMLLDGHTAISIVEESRPLGAKHIVPLEARATPAERTRCQFAGSKGA